MGMPATKTAGTFFAARHSSKGLFARRVARLWELMALPRGRRRRPGSSPASGEASRGSRSSSRSATIPTSTRAAASLDAQRDARPNSEVLVAMDGSRRRPRGAGRAPRKTPAAAGARAVSARNAAVREAEWRGTSLYRLGLSLPSPTGSRRPRGSSKTRPRDGGPGVLAGERGVPAVRLIQLGNDDRYVASHAAAGSIGTSCNTRNFAIRAAIARELPLPEAFPRGGDAVYGWLLESAPSRFITSRPGGSLIAIPHPAGDEARRAFAQGKTEPSGAASWASTCLDLALGRFRVRSARCRLLFATRGRPVALQGRFPRASSRRRALLGFELRPSGSGWRRSLRPVPPRSPPRRPALHGASDGTVVLLGAIGCRMAFVWVRSGD